MFLKKLDNDMSIASRSLMNRKLISFNQTEKSIFKKFLALIFSNLKEEPIRILLSNQPLLNEVIR